MDGIRGGLGYPGGRSGSMGNEAGAGNLSHGFGGLGYPGGRTGYMGQFDNHAFGATEQATNQAPAATSNPLTAINSKIFGRGTFTLPFFGNVPSSAIGVTGAYLLYAYYYGKWPFK